MSSYDSRGTRTCRSTVLRYSVTYFSSYFSCICPGKMEMAWSVTFSILLTISYFCSVLSRCCSAAVVAKAVFYSFVILRVRISPEGGALRYRYGFMSRLTLHGLLVSYGPLRKIKEKRKGREEQAKSVLPTFLLMGRRPVDDGPSDTHCT